MFNTYEQMQQLVADKKAIRKTEGNLDIFKYHRSVMYNYEWFDNPALMECRGHVYDNRTGKLAVAAPRKSFNYLENGWCKDVHNGSKVKAFKKYNGYMVCGSMHDGELIVSTTGSLSSDYAIYAYPKVWQWMAINRQHMNEDDTFLFEMVDNKFDPHIVNDPDDLHYLGVRSKLTGMFLPNESEYWFGSLGELLERAKYDTGEGWMVYPQDGTNRCMKVKTDYYVNKKKLMRMNKTQVAIMFNPKYDSGFRGKWVGVVGLITSEFTESAWVAMNDQQRRVEIERIMNV